MKRFAIAVAGIAALLAFGASGAAQASVAPRPDNVVGTLYDQVGNAGYYTQSFANTYNQVNGSFTLTYQGTEEYGGVGLQLCSATDGHAAQLGAEPTGTEGQWFIGYWRGYLDNENPTGDGDPCNGSPFLTGTGGAFVNLGTITLTAADPTATVQARIDQTARGIEFYASDSALVTYGPVFVPSFADPFTEAAAGISLNGTSLTPAANLLSAFSNVTARNQSNVSHGFAWWNAVQVVSSATDNASNVVLTPDGSLTPAVASRTWHPGHSVKGVWHGGYWTSIGLGPSSFSILGGSVAGP